MICLSTGDFTLCLIADSASLGLSPLDLCLVIEAAHGGHRHGQVYKSARDSGSVLESLIERLG